MLSKPAADPTVSTMVDWLPQWSTAQSSEQLHSPSHATPAANVDTEKSSFRTQISLTVELHQRQKDV